MTTKKKHQRKGRGSLPSRSSPLQALGHYSPLHTFESPPFFRFMKLWKLKAFKVKPSCKLANKP